MGIGFPTNRIPTYVKSTAKTLIDSGYSAYLVGGAVRDLLLEKNTKDFDIATNALPEEVTSLFPKSITTGSKFGNIIVVAEDEYGERYDVDVTTFRKDEDYFGGRWPTSVEFSKTIESDLSRRDFTINALALDLNTVLTDSDKFIEVNDLDDHHNGIDDLLNKVIRTVGDPYERFKEDGLRAFRACRFASELNFTIAEDTKEAIKVSKNIAEMISMERIRDEFLKILMHSKNPSTGIRLLDELNLLDFVIPELIKTKGINQPEWHDQDVFEHSLKTMDLAEDNIKVAALLHDIGKAYTKTTDSDGNVHFYGHDVKGAEVSKKILKRLRFSNAEIDRISNLIRWHMFYYPSADWRKDNKIETLEESEENNFESDDHGWGDAAIRRFIRNVGGVDQLEDLIKLRIADASANEKSEFNPIELQALESRIAEVLKKDMALKVTDLKISGNDLIDLGFSKGKKIGEILNELLEIVTDEPELNERESLLGLSKKLYEETASAECSNFMY